MDYDEALKIVGEWGRYQKQVYIFLSLPIVFKGFQIMLVLFTAYVPKHRCAVPGLLNDTYRIVNEQHERLVMNSIPTTIDREGLRAFDQCRIYSSNNNSSRSVGGTSSNSANVSVVSSSPSNRSIIRNSSDLANRRAMVAPPVELMDMSARGNDGDERQDQTRRTELCSRWVYDKSVMASSLVSKLNMVCERKALHAHSNMIMMAGCLAGSAVTTALADRLGRKRLYYWSLLITTAFTLLTAFVTSITTLLVFRFFSGMGLMGMMVSGFVLCVELIGGPMRTIMGVIWQIMWLLGPFILAGLTYFLKEWQYLQLAGSLPFLLFMKYWWLIPESPRWLLSKGRVTEAMGILSGMAKYNNKTIPAGMARELKRGNGPGALNKGAKTSNPMAMCAYPVLILRFIVINFNWAVISMAYIGLSLGVANLSGEFRVNFIISNSVELVGYVFAALSLEYLGRKKLHCSSMLIGGLACLSTIFTNLYAGHDKRWATMVLAMIGKLGASSAFAVIYLYTAEVYPTVVRNFGVGAGSLFARVGSIGAPYIADLSLYIEGSFGVILPLIVFGASTVCAGLLSLMLPETAHRKMPETILEAANLKKNAYIKHDKITEEKEHDIWNQVDDTSGTSSRHSGVTNMTKRKTKLKADVKKQETKFPTEVKKGEAGFQSDVKNEETSFQSDVQKGGAGFQSDVKNEETSFQSDVQKRGAGFQSDVKNEETSFQSDVQKRGAGFQSDVKNGKTGFQSDMQKEETNFQSDMEKGGNVFQSDVKKGEIGFPRDTKGETFSIESDVDSESVSEI